jgi:hypothetical protein
LTPILCGLIEPNIVLLDKVVKICATEIYKHSTGSTASALRARLYYAGIVTDWHKTHKSYLAGKSGVVLKLKQVVNTITTLLWQVLDCGRLS